MEIIIISNIINISAEEFEFFISSDNSKIVLVNGNINTYPFNEINALIDSKKKYFIRAAIVLIASF